MCKCKVMLYLPHSTFKGIGLPGKLQFKDYFLKETKGGLYFPVGAKPDFERLWLGDGAMLILV